MTPLCSILYLTLAISPGEPAPATGPTSILPAEAPQRDPSPVPVAAAPVTRSADAAPDVASVGLIPARLYAGLGTPLSINVIAPDADAPALSIVILDARGERVFQSTPISPGSIDLAELFPSLWAEPSTEVRYAQLLMGAGDEQRAAGAPLVLEPLITRPAYIDTLSEQALAAFDRRDLTALQTLMSIRGGARLDLLSAPIARTPAPAPTVSGMRVYVDQRVVLDTAVGSITIALRPDAAPATAYRFLELAQGGFYDGLTFHRVIAEDARGDPYLIQAGDPTSTGAGGAGERLAFEPSTLAHDFGIVSMARHAADPNSASGQFFICLSRRACAALDGKYASFAQVVDGAAAVRTIATAPVGRARPDDPRSPMDRPLKPVRIDRVRLIPAPPIESVPAVAPPPPPDVIER